MMIEIAREADLVLIAEMARATALRGGEVDLGDLAPTTVVRSSGQRLGAAYHGRCEVEFVEWFPMRFDEGVIAACLDDTWCPVPAVKRLLRNSWPAENVSEALRRLARAGKIEKREHNTNIPRYRQCVIGRVFKIEFYRPLQQSNGRSGSSVF